MMKTRTSLEKLGVATLAHQWNGMAAPKGAWQRVTIVFPGLEEQAFFFGQVPPAARFPFAGAPMLAPERWSLPRII